MPSPRTASRPGFRSSVAARPPAGAPRPLDPMDICDASRDASPVIPCVRERALSFVLTRRPPSLRRIPFARAPQRIPTRISRHFVSFQNQLHSSATISPAATQDQSYYKAGTTPTTTASIIHLSLCSVTHQQRERQASKKEEQSEMAGEKKQGLQLLDFWVSPFGQRCRIALDEKALPYEYLEQDLGNKSELLLRSNPVHKKIPVLLHDGRPVCESLVIVQYIDEAFASSGPALLPADPYARAQARFWADYVDKKVYDCGTRLWKLKGEPQQQARREMVEILKTLEGALGDRPYFGGDAFGFMDVAFVPFTSWFLAYERFGEFSVEKECPRLAAWAKRCGERDSVRKNLHPPEKVYEFIGVLKKRYGVE